MFSHDWPLGIEQHGNTQALLRKKPFFRAEVEQNRLGSPPNREILDTVQPKWWFSAHLHVKFKATLRHHTPTPEPTTNSSKSTKTPSRLLIPSQVTDVVEAKEELERTSQEKSINENGDDGAAAANEDETTNVNVVDTNDGNADSQKDVGVEEERATKFHGVESSSNQCAGGPDLTDQMTQFLALDKCLPRRQYLSILHVPSTVPREEARLEYDVEWLAILQKTHHLTCTQRRRVEVSRETMEVSDSDMEEIVTRLKGQGRRDDDDDNGLAVPDNFCQTVPLYSDPLFQKNSNCPPFQAMGNPQTDMLLDVLGLEHVLTVPSDPDLTPEAISSILQGTHLSSAAPAPVDANEINIDDLSDGSEDKEKQGEEQHSNKDAKVQVPPENGDENEIDIESSDEDDSPNDNKVSDDTNCEDKGGLPMKKARIDG
jgi:lariat debranching enzyme